MEFDRAFEILIDPSHEGGYSDNYKDRGNWTSGVIGQGLLKGTKYGISAMSYPHLDIINLTREDVKKLYKKDFWDRCRLDEFPPKARFDIFDTAVNSGCVRAIRLLQHALGVAEDGIIGSTTIRMANQKSDLELKLLFNSARLFYLASLNSWDDFSEGWSKRIAKNLTIME